jgi:2-C-methyl-D-erythritol 4-phosphate cytidylyltransferase
MLGEKLVFEWSLEALLSFGCDPVVCVFPTKHLEWAGQKVRRDRVISTGGGRSRQASVAAGLELVDASIVIVHDAARPFVTQAMLAAVTDRLSEHDGAITALRMNETLKRAGDDLVIETVDRSNLWRSQTPQAFRTVALKQAHSKARDESFAATDDAQLIERYGGRIAIVPGDPANIKLTYEDDFVVAQAMIESTGAGR